MKNNNLNIYSIEPGQGLGVLKFGLERSAVEKILGKPDEIESYSYSDEEGDTTENWHYDDLELSLGFYEEENWRLTTIAVSSADYLYKDSSPIGFSKEKLKSLFEGYGITDLEHEDLSSTEIEVHEVLTSESLQINFWFENNELSEIQWGPLFNDDETFDWPELN